MSETKHSEGEEGQTKVSASRVEIASRKSNG